MQLLESLTYGLPNITEQDILDECAYVQGYLECMDMVRTESVLEESVVMEGIGEKLIELFKALIEKIKGLFTRIARFFRKKKNHDRHIDVPQDDDNGPVDEKCKSRPYSGPNAIAVERICVLLAGVYEPLANSVYTGLNEMIHEVSDMVKMMASLSTSQRATMNAMMLMPKKVLFKKMISEVVEDLNEEYLKELVGEITDPQSFKTIPETIYNEHMSKFGKFSNKAFTKEQLEKQINAYNSALDKYNSLAVKVTEVSENIAKKADELKKVISNEQRNNNLSKTTSKMLAWEQDIMTLVINAATALTNGTVAVNGRLEKDLDTIGGYLKAFD